MANAQAERLGEALLTEDRAASGYVHTPKGGLVVDTSNRQDVVDFYTSTYLASEGFDADWDGRVATCDAGTISQAFLDATLLRINWFRAMVGLSADIVLNPEWNVKCQDAALMFIANAQLSHTPPTAWDCYTGDGAEAAGKSNIGLGNVGPASIDAYIEDDGGSNTPLGHRRWILYPPQETMGYGATTAVSSFFHGSNSLWVIGGASGSSAQDGSWPPEGFVPWQTVYPRWSYSFP
jgi:hypothetical protein